MTLRSRYCDVLLFRSVAELNVTLVRRYQLEDLVFAVAYRRRRSVFLCPQAAYNERAVYVAVLVCERHYIAYTRVKKAAVLLPAKRREAVYPAGLAKVLVSGEVSALYPAVVLRVLYRGDLRQCYPGASLLASAGCGQHIRHALHTLTSVNL